LSTATALLYVASISAVALLVITFSAAIFLIDEITSPFADLIQIFSDSLRGPLGNLPQWSRTEILKLACHIQQIKLRPQLPPMCRRVILWRRPAFVGVKMQMRVSGLPILNCGIGRDELVLGPGVWIARQFRDEFLEARYCAAEL
jgi:hypothetical protein